MTETPRDESARRLAAIVEWSDDAIIGKDTSGIITSWNRAAERMFGYSAAEAIGQSIELIVPRERFVEERDVLRRLASGDTIDHFDTVRVRRDGTELDISLTVSPVRDEHGLVIGASAIARNVTDRKRIEKALAAAEVEQADLRQRLSALVAASGELLASPQLGDVLPNLIHVARRLITADAYAVWRVDPEAGVWRVGASDGLSSAFTSLTAAGPPMETVATRFPDVIAISDINGEPMVLERRAYEREGIRAVLAVPLRHGGAFSSLLACYYRTTRPFSDVERAIGRALGNLAMTAITTAELYEAQRRITARAERSRRRDRLLADAGARLASSYDYRRTLGAAVSLLVPGFADWCAVDIVDGDRLTRVAAAADNPRDGALLEPAGDADPLAIDLARDVAEHARPLFAGRGGAAGDKAGTREMRARAFGASSLLCVPMTAHGGVLGAITMAMSGSGREYSEDDLRFAQDLAYRTALAVDNARAYAQVSAANRAKDEFLATLSHELRTPLNAVLGWTRMLRAGTVRPERLAHAIEVIDRNATAQFRLVEDLLDLSRIVTGKFRLEVQPVDLVAVIRAAIESVQPAMAAKDIRFELRLGEDVDPVPGDAARLQQAMWNVLSNAIKFTPRGGCVIVELRPEPTQAVVTVTDTGSGIPADILPFVFDRFRQGDSGPAREYTGLGLGLAIVRHIVELHGGQVDAASGGEGQGASIRLVLPTTADVRSTSSGRDRARP